MAYALAEGRTPSHPPPEGAGRKIPRGPEPDTASRGCSGAAVQLLLALRPVTSHLKPAWGGK